MRAYCLFSIIVALLCSCSSRPCSRTLTCQHKQLWPLFTGFSPGELDAVTAYTFTAGTLFADTLSAHIYAQPDSVPHFGGGSPSFFHNGFGSLSLQTGYDYIFRINATGQVIRISSISDTANVQVDVDCRYPGSCFRSLTGAVVAGSTLSVIDSTTPAIYLGLQKQ